jgi:leader peptidase (prepilin peptidase) / N-methyltransferase
MMQPLEPLETLIRHAPWLALAWIAFLGACVGSFMNVVVYRLPAGQSLLHPGSRCPACDHAIRWYDNVPVIGWLRLRGRCRDCRTPISRRYPSVEALVLGLWVLQWLQDVGGVADGAPLGPAVLAFLWHVSLLCVLICAALIDFDGHRTPVSLLLFGTAVPWILGMTWPAAAAQPLLVDAAARVWEAMTIGAALAALATWAFRPSLWWYRPAKRRGVEASAWQPLALAAMSGLYLGPGRALAVALLTSLAWRLLPRMRRVAGGGAPWSWYLTAFSWLAVAMPV